VEITKIAGGIAAIALAAGLAGAAHGGTAAAATHRSCVPGLRAAGHVAHEAGASLENRALKVRSGTPKAWAVTLSKAGDKLAARAARNLAAHPSAKAAGLMIVALEATEASCVTKASTF
jgi:hypothetical protein